MGKVWLTSKTSIEWRRFEEPAAIVAHVSANVIQSIDHREWRVAIFGRFREVQHGEVCGGRVKVIGRAAFPHDLVHLLDLLSSDVQLLLQVLHLLDGRHSTVGLLGELAFDPTTRAFRTARSFGCVAFDLALSAGIATGILAALSIRSLLSRKSGSRGVRWRDSGVGHDCVLTKVGVR